MKKYYIVTLIAALAIVCLQAIYTVNSYNDYIEKKLTQCDEILHLSINYELLKRAKDIKIAREQKNPTLIFYKSMHEMTREELDSLLDIMPLPKTPTNLLYDVDELIEKGVIRVSEELSTQKTQDKFYDDGWGVNMADLDSIFISEMKTDFQHRIRLYDKDMNIVGYSGDESISRPNYISPLKYIGLKGRHFIQLEARFPMTDYLKESILIIVLSALLMIIALICLWYQIAVIIKTSHRLKNHEKSVNGIIHDLKSPLVSIIAFLDLYQLKENNPSLLKIITANRASLDSLIGKIESLLSSVDKGRNRFALNKDYISIVSLAESVEHISNDLSLAFPDKKHSFTINNHTHTDCVVCADRMYLESSIRNLIENALKYSDSGVTVNTTLKTEGESFIIEVADTGWGIDKKELKRIFRQFYRGESATNNIDGYGIGLAHVKSIIKAHKGTISVKSIKNSGSIFKISLPLS